MSQSSSEPRETLNPHMPTLAPDGDMSVLGERLFALLVRDCAEHTSDDDGFDEVRKSSAVYRLQDLPRADLLAVFAGYEEAARAHLRAID